jgi:hypothetical protein
MMSVLGERSDLVGLSWKQNGLRMDSRYSTCRNIQAKATLSQGGYGRYGCKIALDGAPTKYG